jgi:hypothetical protein
MKALRQAQSLFLSCQAQAMRPEFYTKSGLVYSFLTEHLLLVLHVWVANRRILDMGDPGKPLQVDNFIYRHPLIICVVKEEFFDEFWDDTAKRIRHRGIPEIMVNRRLQDIQEV